MFQYARIYTSFSRTAVEMPVSFGLKEKNILPVCDCGCFSWSDGVKNKDMLTNELERLYCPIQIPSFKIKLKYS